MSSTSRKILVVAAWVVIAVMLGGCVTGTAPDTDPNKLEGTWVLKAFVGVSSGIPSDPSVNSELTLKAGRATGSGGVNSFSCTYQASSAGKISFREFTAQTMTGSAAATEQESKFFAALQKARQFEIYKGDLVLSEMTAFGSNGLVVLAPKSGTPATASVVATGSTPT